MIGYGVRFKILLQKVKFVENLLDIIKGLPLHTTFDFSCNFVLNTFRLEKILLDLNFVFPLMTIIIRIVS